MLKIVKMMSLYFLAATLCEQASLGIPPHLLKSNSSLHHVTVSAYANHSKCTGPNGGVMASGQRITPEHHGRVIALSRDLASDYELGDQFSLWVKGRLHVVSFQDRMPRKHQKKVDLLLPSIQSCRQFGRNPGILIPLDRT